MKQIFLLSILFFVAVPRPAAQYNTNQNKKWTFGKYAGLDFVSGSPVPFTTGMNTSEGAAAVSDASGNLLFYTNGTDIFNRLGAIMPTGAAVVPNTWGTYSTSQAALIVPVMGNPNRYYVFSMGSIVVAPSYCPLAYCIVDMTLDGGLGDVIPSTIGTPINNLLGEKIAAVAGNNCNIWVLVHRRDSAKFFAYEITGAGINLTPVISTSGTLLSSPATSLGAYAQGVLRFSPDRQRVVVQAANAQTTELHDFNPSTGVVSNCRVLSSTRNQYGAAFSPDNTKLYTLEFNAAPASTNITQYNIALPTTPAIIASAYTVTTLPMVLLYSELQLGPDDRIYSASVAGGTGFLDRINNPNMAGAACGFTPNAVALAPGTQVFLGLHNAVITVMPADTTHTQHDTALCISPGGATIWPHGTGTSYSWYDGATTPSHNVTTPGTYWVAVINGCTVQFDTIHVTNLPGPPAPVITGDTTYCYGDPFVPFAVIGTGILWYTSASSTTGSPTAPFVNTSVPGVYTFYATQTVGCESPKASITVTVLPGITPGFTWVIRPGCVSDTIEFTNTTTGVNSYLWNFGDASPTDTSSLHTTHIYSPHGVYSITLTAHSANGCMGETTFSLDTHNSIGAGFNILPDTLCAGSAATLIMTSPPATIAKYLWNFGNGDTTSTTLSPVRTYSVPGIFPVTLTTTDTVGCADTLTKNVYVIGLRINTFHDTTLCVSRRLKLFNDIILLPGNVSDDFVFHWTPAQHLSDTAAQMPEYSGVGLTTYTFTATVKPYGCFASDTIRVHGIPGKPLTHVTNDTTILLGGSVQLNSWNEIYYRWIPNDGSLSNPNINNPVATPVFSTLYTVFGYDGDGCLDSAFVMIYVDSSMDECIPSGFTPNGDGLNDIFRPLCLRQQKVIEFNIYNRWGQMVFHATSADKGWDGTYMGQPQELGVYFYMITIARPNMQNIIYKGDLTLIR